MKISGNLHPMDGCQILEYVHDAIIILDEANTIKYVNSFTEKMLSARRIDLIEKKLHDIISIENSHIENCHEHAYSSSGLDPNRFFLVNGRDDVTPITFSITPMYGGGGSSAGNLFMFLMRNESRQTETEMKLIKSINTTRSVLTGIIHAMSLAIEYKDPYTAGHQRKVAELAGRIAQELYLSEEMTESIRFGGMLHDIGKISIPTEILVKPGPLNDYEVQYIRRHVEIGFQILNSIEFPWPLSEIVYQHHERLDGSGYPRGLSGDQLLFEAQVIGAADIIEAMASHRPYRPALGLDAALKEIHGSMGKKIHPEIIEACIRVFQDEQFNVYFANQR